MSAATFTPGPWRIRSQAPVGGVYTLTIEQVDGRMIGEVWASHGNAIGDSRPEPEGCANAGLIAAAPELLESAREYLRAIINTYGQPPHLDRVANALKYAIAKAEGSAD